MSIVHVRPAGNETEILDEAGRRWTVPGSMAGIEGWALWAVQIGAFAAKVGFFLVLYVWVRWTLPRFRYDQLMDIGWKRLFPLALINIVITALLVAFEVI